MSVIQETQDKVKKKTFKTRNFSYLIYPDSAPDNWLDLIYDSMVPGFLSPKHTDNIENGKKEHYHGIICFDGPKTIENAIDTVKAFGGVRVQPVNSLRGACRYLCHLDNPDKVQYSVSYVKSFFGADYDSTIEMPNDKYKAIRDMISFCAEKGVTSYSDFLEYCIVNRQDWFKVLCDNGTYVLDKYLKSKSWTLERRSKQNF